MQLKSFQFSFYEILSLTKIATATKFVCFCLLLIYVCALVFDEWNILKMYMKQKEVKILSAFSHKNIYRGKLKEIIPGASLLWKLLKCKQFLCSWFVFSLLQSKVTMNNDEWLAKVLFCNSVFFYLIPFDFSIFLCWTIFLPTFLLLQERRCKM